MSFNTYVKVVRDESLPMNYRVHAFGSCVVRYSSITGVGFIETYTRIGDKLGFAPFRIYSDKALLEAIKILETERNAFLARLKQFDKQRRAEKSHGQRQPRKEQLEHLYRTDFINL